MGKKTPCAQPVGVIRRKSGPPPSPEVLQRVRERTQQDLRNRQGRSRLIPESESPDDPRIVAIEAQQRRLHEAGLPTTNPPPVTVSQTELSCAALVRMVAWEILTWGPRSHKRLTQELAEGLRVPYAEADGLVREAIRVEEKRRQETRK